MGMTASRSLWNRLAVWFLTVLVPPASRNRPVRRLTQLLLGLVLYGISDSLLVLARLGLDPWDVFHQGLARHTGIPIGTWSILVGVAVLFLWIPLRQRPGIGTLLNAILIGAVMDLILGTFAPPHALWLRVALLVLGVFLCGVATGAYIGAGLGPGPRDGVMMGLAARGYSLRKARTAIELTVLIAGWLLGGNVGVGTLVYALGIGPLAHIFIPFFTVKPLAVADQGAPEGTSVTAL
jgi:uncharacterized membrane protein YczE